MTRTPVQLGADGSLFGIRFLPSGVRPSRHGIIILNAGLLHHVGPFRLHIDLANRLVESGYSVICLDQSGKGESPRRKGVDRAQSLLMDFDDVMNELAQFGVTTAVLIGLCSGADDATVIASERSNVSGIVALDGYARRNLRFHFNHYARKLSHASSWRNLIGKVVTRARNRVGVQNSDGLDIRNWDSDDEMSRRLTDFLVRGGKLLSVFTTGQDYYNYRGQLAANLGRAGAGENLHEVYYADANHTYTLTSHRQRLIEQIETWLRQAIQDTGRPIPPSSFRYGERNA